MSAGERRRHLRETVIAALALAGLLLALLVLAFCRTPPRPIAVPRPSPVATARPTPTGSATSSPGPAIVTPPARPAPTVGAGKGTIHIGGIP